jgi:antigen flippase
MPAIAPEDVNADTASYGQILRSSSITGGAAGVTLLLGMLRIKCAALLIGPVGVGLVGIYQALQDLAGTVAGLGIQQSAVRDIAAAAHRNDHAAIGRLLTSLRRICWLTGIGGGLGLLLLAFPLSRYTFGSSDYATDIALLAPTIFLARIQAGQAAILQGLRRIEDLARLNILGAACGTAFAVLCYAWLGLRGIIPALLLLALAQTAASWFFVRRIAAPTVPVSWRDTLQDSQALLRLGLAFMSSGLMAALVAYLARSWITQQVDLMAVGLFTAAFSLSGMFINFILSAMGADYYPRLTAAAPDRGAMARLVNEQTEIGLLLAVPGLLATLTLAPWIIRMFFSVEFLPAAELLQWFVLGCLGRVVSWPLGYVLLALAHSGWFFTTEASFNLLHLALIWTGLMLFGVEGTAIAFFVAYAVYAIALYLLARHLIDFAWSAATLRLLSLLLPLLALGFFSARHFSPAVGAGIGLLLSLAAALACLRGLVRRIGQGHWVVQRSFRIPGIRRLCGFTAHGR